MLVVVAGALAMRILTYKPGHSSLTCQSAGLSVYPDSRESGGSRVMGNPC
jgi:hypothetical protein